MLVVLTIFSVMIYNGSAKAGDSTMQTNMNDMAVTSLDEISC